MTDRHLIPSFFFLTGLLSKSMVTLPAVLMKPLPSDIHAMEKRMRKISGRKIDSISSSTGALV